VTRIWLLTASVIATAALAAPAGASGYVVTIGTHAAINFAPWCGDQEFDACRFQCLWPRNQINHAGYIDAVEFDAKSKPGGATFYDVRVWLCHTNKTELEATFDNNYTGFTPVQVKNDKELSIPQQVGYVDIGIRPHLFYYNNTNNLLMEIRWHTSDWHTVPCWVSKQTKGRVLAFRDNGMTGNIQDYTECIRFHIETMTGVVPASFGKVKALFR